MDERQKLLQAIALQETLRGVADDAIIDAAIAALREKAITLESGKEEHQRKQVTIFFADLVNFMGLSASLDPEEISIIQDAYFQCCRRFIDHFGGQIEKYIGDAVMAVFGIPNLHEKDPENAVRAALGIQSGIAELNQSFTLPVPLKIRIGINTGEVFVHYRSEGNFLVVGDVVNITKRLEESAPDGGILIDHNTYSHVRHIFSTERQPPLLIKGKSAPLQSYLITSPEGQNLPDSSYRTAVGDVPMIGREQELTTLQSIFGQVKETRKLCHAFISGDSGLGKSRLIEEFLNWIKNTEDRRPPLHFHLRTDWHSRYIPYTLLYKLFAAYFDFKEVDSRSVLREKLVNGFIQMMGPGGEEKAHFLGQLIGLDFAGGNYVSGITGDAEQIFGRSMHYLHQFFTQLSLRRPILLVLEDVQWADTGSLNMIAQVARRCQKLPILIICTARPQFLEQEQPWFDRLLDCQIIELQPLSHLESEQFSRTILKRVNNVPGLLLKKIVESAGGNPYYIEELVWMLIEDNIIFQDGQQWWVDEERLEELRIPPTLTAVLQARLDRLSDGERQVLQRAAAVGRHFWEAAIEHLLIDKENLLAESKTILTRLSQRKLIRPLYNNGNGTGNYQKPGFKRMAAQNSVDLTGSWQAYAFQYPLLHEVTYNSILKADRRLYHRQIADWFMQFNAKGGIETYSAMIARHYDRAGEIEQAGIWYGKAAEFARTAYAYQEALENYQQALQLMPVETANPERIPLLEGLGMMLVASTRYEEALQTFHIMLAEAEVTGNRPAQSTALIRMGFVYFNMGNHHASLSSSTRAEQVARSLVPVQLLPLANALTRKCSALLYLGHIQESLKVGHEALTIARQMEDERLVAYILGEIYLSYKALGQHGKAQEYIEQSLKIEEKRGDLAAAARSINSLGELARLQGDYEKAATYYHRAYLTLDEIGDIAYAKLVLSNLGGVMVATGDYAAALVPLEEVVATIGTRWLALPETYRFMAEAYLGLENIPAALNAVQESMKLGRIQDNPEFTGNAWRVLGKVAARLGHPVPANEQKSETIYSAEDCFKKSCLIFKQASMERDLAFSYWDWGDYALSQGDHEMAHQYRQMAREIFVKLEFPLLIGKLTAGLANETTAGN